MLMAKSCHDIDWLHHVVGEPATRVSSFGGLRHFTSTNRPDGAADRCVDCSLRETCTFSATRFYGGLLASGGTGWPLDTVVGEPTGQALDAALASGPYGRCVYACDNDVVDHQVVNLEFGSGVTASFTMTAFAEMGHRRTQIFGTKGELECDGRVVTVREFGPELGCLARIAPHRLRGRALPQPRDGRDDSLDHCEASVATWRRPRPGVRC